MLLLTFICTLFKKFAASRENGPRIINGTNAELGMFPSTVALLNRSKKVSCSGSLIYDRVILTAAHCIGYFVYVLAGKTQIDGMSDFRQLRDVVKTIIHPNFQQLRQQSYDLGIVYVDKPFNITKYVKPISLCDRLPRAGEVCTNVGWGETSLKPAPNLSKKTSLMYQDLRILDYRHCFFIFFDWHLICAYSKYSQVHNGDSGGPLICQNQLCGVCSATVPDAIGTINVFGNVVRSKVWIKSNGTKSGSLRVSSKIQQLLKIIIWQSALLVVFGLNYS